MAEAYDAAMRRRLGIINDMGSSATDLLQQRMRMPGNVGEGVRSPGNFGQAVRRPGSIGGHSYNGPRGNEQGLINFGKFLQSQGFRISEHPYFNGGRRVTGGHTKGSRHYSNRAIDVNFAPGTSRREQQAIDRIVGLASLYGLRSIWRKPDHYGHAHFDF
jgi:hypothetical protein